MSDLRSALEDAFKNEDTDDSTPVVESSAPVENDTAAPKDEADQPGRARDEYGRYAAKPAEPPATDASSAAPAVHPDAPVAPTRNAFSSWKPDAQAALAKAERGEALTPDELKILRSEAERREGDWHKGVEQFKSHSDRAKTYDAAFAPFQSHLQRLGVDAPTAIAALMQADVKLRTGDPATKAQYFAQLAREYNIDLNNVVNPPQIDPQTQYLQQQVAQLQQSQQMWQNQMQQQEQTRAQNELQSFAQADKPHFDAVRNEMADLLETGKAKDLQEAYDMAVWMKPDVRQTLIEQREADAQRKALEQAQSQRAKTAAVSVKGSSPNGAGSQPVAGGSLRDVISAQFD